MCYSTEAACHVVGPALLLGRARIQDVEGHHPERPTFDSHVRPSLRPCKHAVKKIFTNEESNLLPRKVVRSRHSKNIKKTSCDVTNGVCQKLSWIYDALGCFLLSFRNSESEQETAYQPSPYIWETERNTTHLLFVNFTMT